jgi:hypothetical protein
MDAIGTLNPTPLFFKMGGGDGATPWPYKHPPHPKTPPPFYTLLHKTNNHPYPKTNNHPYPFTATTKPINHPSNTKKVIKNLNYKHYILMIVIL